MYWLELVRLRIGSGDSYVLVKMGLGYFQNAFCH